MSDTETVIGFPTGTTEAKDASTPSVGGGTGTVPPTEPPTTKAVPVPSIAKVDKPIKVLGTDTLTFIGALFLMSLIVGGLYQYGKSTGNKSVQQGTWYLVIVIIIGMAISWSDKLLALSPKRG